jgi:uncharacterized membrane protein
MEKRGGWFKVYWFPIVWLSLILVIFFGSVITSSSEKSGLINPYGRDYHLTGTNVLIALRDDGEIYVNEGIGYKFKGCYKEVFRDVDILYPKEYEDTTQLEEPFISKIGARCQPECNVIDRNYEIAGNFGEICDQEAEFFVNFKVLKGIVIGNDVAEFHYKIWGDKWEKQLEQLNGTILMPLGMDVNSTRVFFNPIGVLNESYIEGNALKFTTGSFDGYFEVRLLMPKESFNSSENFLFDENLLKEDIISIQKDYEKSYRNYKNLGIVSCCIILFSLILLPLIFYINFGKEPEIRYNGVFEREPIKGIKPYVINSLCTRKTGDTDKNAITATLLDLIRRKHIQALEVDIKRRMLFREVIKKELALRFIQHPRDQLSRPEMMVYKFFKGFADQNSELVWSDLLSKLKVRTEALRFMEFAEHFEKAVDKEYDLKKYFDKKGDTIFKAFCGIMLFIGAVFLIFSLSMSQSYTALKQYLPIYIVCILFSIIGLLLPNKVFGRFTPEGYEIYLRSMNFKRFMADMTLLKNHPPESIVIWEEYLVYATLFGVAEKVLNNLKVSISDASVRSSSLYPVYNINNISILGQTQHIARANSSSSHGGGHVGGGFGGGGGGAR